MPKRISPQHLARNTNISIKKLRCINCITKNIGICNDFSFFLSVRLPHLKETRGVLTVQESEFYRGKHVFFIDSVLL